MERSLSFSRLFFSRDLWLAEIDVIIGGNFEALINKLINID